MLYEVTADIFDNVCRENISSVYFSLFFNFLAFCNWLKKSCVFCSTQSDLPCCAVFLVYRAIGGVDNRSQEEKFELVIL